MGTVARPCPETRTALCWTGTEQNRLTLTAPPFDGIARFVIVTGCAITTGHEYVAAANDGAVERTTPRSTWLKQNKKRITTSISAQNRPEARAATKCFLPKPTEASLPGPARTKS
jgi:hypothetical protein